ncbi:MAG: alanine--tRNA ligase [Bacillota bacterium]|nr:alanine--tRNA ligase [Bacillota bacterium]
MTGTVTGKELRRKFLEFFAERDHLVLDSAPLVPRDDPTLLWINAGVAPLKPYFAGKAEPPRHRLASSQLSLRTSDIENVGHTPRHHTLFEMLGNFSIGDYFKREAIVWGWEYLTGVLGLPAEDLWASVHPTDDEARQIWMRDVGLPPEKVVDDETNFWDIGPGPCGPCSEIYIDRGPAFGCGSPDCRPGCECSRYLELWNLVFSQFNHLESGEYVPLPRKNIDTGMGLERIASVMQGVNSNFECDLLFPLVSEAARLAGKRYGTQEQDDVAMRVIADHLRAITFAVAEGVLPSNEGRGYVIRRLLRRAVRYGQSLGIGEAFLHRLVPVVVDIMGDPYTHLRAAAPQVAGVLRAEEERFRQTLAEGTERALELVAAAREKGLDRLPGRDAFLLYDTYGFPLDLTADIAAEEGLGLDREGFEQAMEEQRERARAARAVEGWDIGSPLDMLLGQYPETDFVGYERLEEDATVLALLPGDTREGNGGALEGGGGAAGEGARQEGAGDQVPTQAGARALSQGDRLLNGVRAGERARVLLDRTPFYAEAGGQVADTGEITHGALSARVLDVQRTPGGRIFHLVEVDRGTLRVGDRVRARVDGDRRLDIARHHTATHLLHRALREVLGSHATQAGSLVAPDRLRFDFVHYQAPSPAELRRVEDLVNEKIMADLPVEALYTSRDEATRMGAVALFGEKYGDTVRVVRMGDFSLELCGGTHLRSTGQAGVFRLTSSSAVAAGVRRVEAVAGRMALAWVRHQEELLAQAAEPLGVAPEQLPARVVELREELAAAGRRIESLQASLLGREARLLAATATEVDGIKVVAARCPLPDRGAMRTLGDEVRHSLGSGVVVLAAEEGGRAYLLAMVTPDLVGRGLHAGRLIRALAPLVGGGGGGKPHMAEAGGREPAGIPDALARVATEVRLQAKQES